LHKDDFYREHYDHLWAKSDHSIGLDDERRIGQTLSLIPPDCSSILDIGCGDGRVTNRLMSKCAKAVGLDSSIKALQSVNTAKVLGNIDHLPFPDKSFDSVLCCEVLEHLPYEIYPRALAEMERVAAKYIIITVPNDEFIEGSQVTCPKCCYRFHPSLHVRSLDKGRLRKLFKGFQLVKCVPCQPRKSYPKLLIKLRRLVLPLPQRPIPAGILCPRCGYVKPSNEQQQSASGQEMSLLQMARKMIPMVKSSVWLLACYRSRHNTV
jgi:SAM-dependent methyltransferase